MVKEADRILLYTDGVFDTTENRPLNQNQLIQELQTVEDRSFVLERILNKARGDQPLAARDDLTLLLLEASPGVSRFDHRTNFADEDTPSISGDPSVSRISQAKAEGLTVLVLEGRMTWEYSQPFFDAVFGSLDRGFGVIVDLSRCIHLDSAVLGTLHELVESAEKTVAGSKVKIQDASHSLVRTFAELGLNSVLRSLQMQSIAIPKTRTAVRVSDGNLRGQQMRLLKAHEVLASLNDTNRDQFALVVDDLREHFTYLSGMTSPR